MQRWFIWALALLAIRTLGAERKFDFNEVRDGQMPPGFRSAVTGGGKPGDRRVILDEKPSAFPARTPEAPALTKQQVLAQWAQDPAHEHFPLLILEQGISGDLTLTTRFKTLRRQKQR